jgi:hypothetical protein
VKDIRFLFIVTLTFAAFPAISQTEYQDFYNQSLKIQNTGMLVLGSWAVGNIATGAYGWANNSGENKYFHQMNLFWNVVNLSIAGFALYNNQRFDYLSSEGTELLAKHQQTEKVLLINAFLDVGYIGGGLLLRHFGNQSEKRKDLMKGYGSSLILQGGFLLVFDAVMYGIMRSHRLGFLKSMNLSIGPEAFELQMVLNL